MEAQAAVSVFLARARVEPEFLRVCVCDCVCDCVCVNVCECV